MEAKYLIGLSGKSGVGKSAVAEILAKYGYQIFSFGNYLRRDLSNWWREPFRIPIPSSIEGTMYSIQENPEIVWRKPTSPEIREALQWYGDYQRWLNPVIYINALWKEMTERKSDSERAVISDVRTPAEYHFVKGRGELWRIEQDLNGNHQGWMGHITEKGLDSYHFNSRLWNDDGLDLLGSLVKYHLQGYDPEAVEKCG